MTSYNGEANEKSYQTGPPRRSTANILQTPSAQIHAPFNGLSQQQVNAKVETFIQETGLSLYREYFSKGTFISQNPGAFNGPRDDGLCLTDEEKSDLDEEEKKSWKHPAALWQLVILCAIGAATQGWDESAVDGGMAFTQIERSARYMNADCFHLQRRPFTLMRSVSLAIRSSSASSQVLLICVVLSVVGNLVAVTQTLRSISDIA